MAAIIAYSSLNLSETQQRDLCTHVEQGVSEAVCLAVDKVNLMIMPNMPDYSHGPSASNQITYFVYTASGKSDDMKRAIVKKIYDGTVAVTGKLEPWKVIVIIKEHPDNHVGVDGMLKIDL